MIARVAKKVGAIISLMLIIGESIFGAMSGELGNSVVEGAASGFIVGVFMSAVLWFAGSLILFFLNMAFEFD
jgi:hypothetical protein